MHPKSHTVNPAPYTLHPTPYILHPTPYNLHPTPYTLRTLNPTPECRFGVCKEEGRFENALFIRDLQVQLVSMFFFFITRKPRVE